VACTDTVVLPECEALFIGSAEVPGERLMRRFPGAAIKLGVIEDHFR
jgi:hypothetical protein